MRKRTRGLAVALLVVLLIWCAGCSGTASKTPADYNVTRQVVLAFMDANMSGDVEGALEYVAEEAKLDAESDTYKGKAYFREMIQINADNKNQMEILEEQKLDNGKMYLKVSNKLPLYQIAGVEEIKTKETFTVADGKITLWKIEHYKDSVKLVEEKAGGTLGIEVEEQNGQIVVTKVEAGSEGEAFEVKPGDIILAIDDVELKDMTEFGIDEVPYRLVGQAGSTVKVKIEQNGEIFEYKMYRK